jgi:hypothetical protein
MTGQYLETSKDSYLSNPTQFTMFQSSYSILHNVTANRPTASLKYHGTDDGEGGEEYIKFRECLLLFSPKSFVFPSHIKKPKD